MISSGCDEALKSNSSKSNKELQYSTESNSIIAARNSSINGPYISTSVRYLGPIISSTKRGTHYASSYGSIIEDHNDWHVFYCAGAKPYMPHEDPFHPYQRYGLDMIGYDRVNKGTLQATNAYSPWLVPTLKSPTTTNALQSPCTSSTVYFKNYLYTFFESFSEISSEGQLVAVFVARSQFPGQEPEILTVDGWKKNRYATSKWKPVIVSTVVKEAQKGNVQASKLIEDNIFKGDGVGNNLWGAGVPTAVYSKEQNKIVLAYHDSTYGHIHTPQASYKGKFIVVTSTDGVNFTHSHAVEDYIPGTGLEIKIIRDTQSKYNGYYAVFSKEYANTNSQYITARVSFSKDLKIFKNEDKYELARFLNPLRDKAPQETSVMSARVSGNQYGEISPFSKEFLYNLSLPRLLKWYDDGHPAENRDIYGYKMKFLQSSTKKPTPVFSSVPTEPETTMPRIKLFYTVLNEADGAFYICGEGFNDKASLEFLWSYNNKPQDFKIWYTPDNPNAYVYHYSSIHRYHWHNMSCLSIKLSPSVFSNMKNGWSAAARVYQVQLEGKANTSPYSMVVNVGTNWNL